MPPRASSFSDGVAVQLAADQGVGRAVSASRTRSAQPRGHAVQVAGIVGVGRQQAQHLQGQIGVAPRNGRRQKPGARRRDLQRRSEQLLHLVPAAGVGRGHPAISRLSQAWARRQSRRTVGTETPSDRGHLFVGHPAEETHLHHLALAGLKAVQPVQGAVQFDDRLGRGHRHGDFGVEGHDNLAAPALVGQAAAGVIDQHPAHDPGGDAVEMGAVLPADLVLVDQADDRLRGPGRWGSGCGRRVRRPCGGWPCGAGWRRRGRPAASTASRSWRAASWHSRVTFSRERLKCSPFCISSTARQFKNDTQVRQLTWDQRIVIAAASRQQCQRER